ncbi:MAG: hypothetical protein WBO36_15410 [Saprospiraceae bacterium]
MSTFPIAIAPIAIAPIAIGRHSILLMQFIGMLAIRDYKAIICHAKGRQAVPKAARPCQRQTGRAIGRQAPLYRIGVCNSESRLHYCGAHPK